MTIKKTILFISFLSITIIAKSQSWAPIGAKWTYTLHWAWSSIVDTFVIRSIGDTIIQGKICKVLKSQGTCSGRPAIEYTYADSGKVFFYDASRSIFQMHYNFNAQIGDEYKIFLPQDFLQHDSIIIVVDSISFVIINHVKLKELFTHVKYCNQAWFYQGRKIIENIGDLWFMFPWIYKGCDADSEGPLRCYEDPSSDILYDFHTAPSCDYTNLGIDNIKLQDCIIVYPNPASDNIIVDFKDRQYQNLNIYNIFGQLVLTRELNNIKSEIDIGSLVKGVFLIEVLGVNWQVRKMIIKE